MFKNIGGKNMHISKQPKRWKQSLCTMLSIILIVSSLSFVTVTNSAQAASTTPELIVDYEFKDPGSGSGLPMDKEGNSALTEVSGTHNGQTYGNTTKAYGTDSTGDYWKWTTNTNRGGGFTLDIDPTKVVGKDIEKSYTISVRFSYDSFNSSWTKIIDYKNKTADTGFYFTGNKTLKFYDIGNEGSTAVKTNSIVDIIATRDVATNKFTAYMVVNGVLQKEIEVNDISGQAIPILIDEKIRFGFFHDDYASGGAEKTVGGKVYSIKFWDGALAPANVLEVNATKGEAEGSTKFELPVPQTPGNIFKAKVSEGLLPYPMPGDPLPTGVQDYISDTDLLNVDGNKNKYVGIYEVDSNGQIVGFRLITLTDNEIKANKQALRDKKNEIELENLDETKYSSESWEDLQDKLEEATTVLDNPLATQAEVDQALADLTAAYEALQEVAGVNKAALQAKVDEAAGLTATDYTPETWANYQSQLKAALNVLDDPNVTQEEVNQALANLTAARNALRPVLTKPDLNSLAPSQGALSPSFSSEVTNYTMYVDYTTSQLSFLAIPNNPSALVTMTVNGQAVTNGVVPLAVGANTVIITVQDGTGFKQYTITVYRANDNSSGGGTWTPDPAPNPTSPTNPGTTTTKIKVELEIDGDNPLEKTTVEIERTKRANGEITDFVALTEENAKEAVEKAKQVGNNIARIVIPDVNDEVDKVTVEIPKQSLQTLRENGLSLEISSENGHIAIPQSSMEGIDDSFYFYLVPVKKESERQAIEERAKAEQVVRKTIQSNDVNVIARPMTIETNMPSRPVQVTLPLKGVNVPTSSAEREAFLAQLAVFIEHSDGEKKVIFPEVVTMAKGELGLRFTVDKFSTFTIIQFEKSEVSEHEAYIKGFPNGTFGPDKNVTRAQVAIMMARILGYTEDQTVNKAPFKDVAKDHSAAGAIAFVKEQGIMNGDYNGNFHGNANITRAEMAAVVANFKQFSIEEGAAITFKDTKGHWAQWIIEANRAAGIINGLEDESFEPNAALTRAQAVVMMNRMFERGPLHGITKPSFPDVKATHWAFKEIEEAANSHSYTIDEDGKEQLSK